MVHCMSKEKNQIIGIDLEDLKDVIQIAVRNEIETCLLDCRFGTEHKDEVWDRNQVATLLQTTPENVTTGYKKKEIPGKMVGREYRFLKSQIIGTFKKVK